MLQSLLFTRRLFGQSRGVVKTNVSHFGLTGKRRTGLVGMSANRDDVIELDVLQFIEVFRVLRGDIHSSFGHDRHRVGIHPVRLDAGRIRLEDISFEMSAQPSAIWLRQEFPVHRKRTFSFCMCFEPEELTQRA